MKVYKFGGASVQNVQGVKRVAEIIRSWLTVYPQTGPIKPRLNLFRLKTCSKPARLTSRSAIKSSPIVSVTLH